MDHFIPLEQAREMTRRFRENRDNVLVPEYKGRYLIPDAERFDRSAFDRVLAQPGCTALRIYYGMDENLDVHAIIVGVDENNRDQLPPASTHTSDTTEGSDSTDEPQIIESGQRCPPECATDSELNP